MSAQRADLTPGEVADAIEECVALLEETAVDLNRVVTLNAGHDFDEVAELLDRLNVAIDAIAVSRDSVAKQVWELRGDRYGGNVTHPTLGVLDMRYGARKVSWDHETTIQRLIEAHMEETGGEVPSDPAEVIRWVTAAASIGYWRKGALAELGIDADGEDLVHSERGDPKVKVVRPAGPNRLLMPPG